jgi:Kef-type K+ transport system membrane component KefB
LWLLLSCSAAAEVLLPLFFANSGIRTDIGSLSTARHWGITLAIICIACFAKFTPTCLMSKLVTKRDWRFCTAMGLLMNTRGLVEVIALNIGLSMVSGCHVMSCLAGGWLCDMCV